MNLQIKCRMWWNIVPWVIHSGLNLLILAILSIFVRKKWVEKIILIFKPYIIIPILLTYMIAMCVFMIFSK